MELTLIECVCSAVFLRKISQPFRQPTRSLTPINTMMPTPTPIPAYKPGSEPVFLELVVLSFEVELPFKVVVL
jgi:hypothetical protein